MHFPDAEVLARPAQHFALKHYDATIAETFLAIHARLLLNDILMIETIIRVPLADGGSATGRCRRWIIREGNRRRITFRAGGVSPLSLGGFRRFHPPYGLRRRFTVAF